MTAWRFVALSAALLGLLGVILGAVGAHAVPVQDSVARQQWATAWHLHLFHAAALLGIAGLARQGPSALLLVSGSTLLAGSVFFSGSLYLRALGVAWIPGPLTPFGGLLLMAGWLLLLTAVARLPRFPA